MIVQQITKISKTKKNKEVNIILESNLKINECKI